ncbi:MAG: restriction endonuclease [Burkholderiaceae bacterium]
MFPLKMAQNSLFAVLLRSPWWVSLLVAAVVTGLSFAVLPTRFVIFGVAVALPFIVIAGIAAWKQWQAPSKARIEATSQQVAALSWKEFSRLLEQSWRDQGFEVAPFEGHGADLCLTHGWRTTLVSARRWKVARLGAEPLRELMQARERAEAQACIIVSLGEVSANAAVLLKDSRIELYDATRLASLLPAKGAARPG